MFGPCFALALALGSPAATSSAARDGAEPAATEAPLPGEGEGTIVLGPAAQGRAVLVDETGQVVAHIDLIPGRATTIGVPPGRYRIEADGKRIAEVEVGAGETIAIASPPGLAAPLPNVDATEDKHKDKDVGPQLSADSRVHGVAADTTDSRDPVTLSPRERRRSGRWKRWGAPLLSAIIPGAGQVATRRPGRGMAFFTGTVGLTIGAVALAASGDDSEGATRGDPGASAAQEAVRLGGIVALTGAAALLYVGQILDAHGGAVGKVGDRVKPVTDHILAFEFQRSSTVGFSSGEPRYDHFPDYSIAVMGQPFRRVTVGASDLSIKLEPDRAGVVVQGGARAAYRFFDRRRLWLAAGGGIALQGTSARRSVVAVDPADVAAATDEGRFGAFAYAMLDGRIFVLDHWALLVAPRISLPLTERRFGQARTLPRFSTTFELVLGGAVHF